MHTNLFEELKRISHQLSQCPQPLSSANAEIIFATLITSVLPTTKQDQIQQLETILDYLKQKNLTRGTNEKSSANKKNKHHDKVEDSKLNENTVQEEKPLSWNLIEDLLFLRAAYLLVTRIVSQYDVDVVDSTGTHHHHSSSDVSHLDKVTFVVNEFFDVFTKLLQSDPDYFISHSSIGVPSSLSPFHLVCSYMADVTFNPLNGPTPPPSPSVGSKQHHKSSHNKRYNLRVLQLCVSEWSEFLKNQETLTISLSALCLLTLALIRRYPQSNSEQFADFSEEIFNNLTTVLYCEDPLCRKAVINVLLPALTSLHHQHSNKKQLLWEHVTKMYQGESYLKPSSYELLCQLYDWFSGGQFDANSLDVRLQPMFWKIVQEGLLDRDCIIRKQCVWILKRTISLTKLHPSSDYATKAWLSTFWWKSELSDELTRQWDMFFLIYDTFNEYNLHLIKPVWSQLELLHAALDGPAFLPEPTPQPTKSKGKKQNAATKKGTEITKTHLDISWIYILYQNGLTSDNPTIRKWILLSILDSDKQLRYTKQFIFNNILPSMPAAFFRGATGPQAEIAVQKFFTNYILHCKTLPEKIQRIQDILGALCQSDKVNLSVSAFLTNQILHAFSQLPETPAINSEMLHSLSILCDLRMAKLHHIHRPKAYSHLTTVLYNLTDYSQVKFGDTMNLIKYYPATETQIGSNRAILSAWFEKFELTTGGTSSSASQPWLYENMKKYIQEFATPTPAQNDPTAVDVAHYPDHAAQLMRVLTFVRNSEMLLEIIQPVFEQINQIYSHSYMTRGHPEKLLSFLTELLSNPIIVQALGTHLTKKVSDIIEEIISYVNEKVRKQLSSGSSANLVEMLYSVECSKIYLGAIGTCIGYLKQHPKLSDFQLQLLTLILQFLNQTPKAHVDTSTEFAKLASMQCLATLTQHVKLSQQNPDQNYVKLLNDCITAVLNTTFKLTAGTYSDVSLTSDDARKLTVTFSLQKWSSVTNMLTILSEVSSDDHLYVQNSRTIFSHCVEALEVSHFDYTYTLLQSLRLVLVFLVRQVDNESELVAMVDHSFDVAWTACSDQIFRSVPLQCQFLSVAFQPALIRLACFSQSDSSPLKKYYHKILEFGEYTFVIANCLAYYCTLAWSDPQNLHIFKLYLPVLDKLLLFGPNRKGLKEGEEMDDALEYDAYVRSYPKYMLKHSPLTLGSEFTSYEMVIPQPDIYVRARCLWSLQSLERYIQDGKLSNASEVRSFMIEILLMLLNIQKQVTIKLYRCWSDHHKRVIRLWQTITSMVPLFSTMFHQVSDELQEKIAADLWDVLQFHNHKSVRQYIDLFAIHFLRMFDKTRNDKLIKYLSHFNERSDVLHSVITIAGYVMMSLDLQQEAGRTLFNKLVNLIMGHATSHHPTIRRMAQVIIDKAVQYYRLFSGIPPLNESIMTYFLYIQENEECRKYLDAKYHSTLLQHMASNMKDKDINVDLIYHTLTDEDSFPLSECMTQELYDKLVTHSPDKMSIAQPPTEHNISREISEQDDNTVDKEVVHSSEDFQKKIIPWEHTLAYDDSILRETIMIEKSRQEIIIVASLIDRVPNLAGLTRTAEIFNVTALAVPNKKIVSHPQFQEISVSAENWVPMIEVTEEGLKDFLAEKKAEGWTLLGVEQTAKSINLTQFEFPNKCVLVLGKEKEGIPVEFLQLLDDCIIIPQLGVIRSLNVHVSGSIMMFEYTRQQLVRSQSKQAK